MGERRTVESTGCGNTSRKIMNSDSQRERSQVLGALRARSVESPSNLLLDVGGSAAVAKLAARMPREYSKLAQNREEETLLCGAPKNGNAALTATSTQQF